jgi:arylsulfatase A-like enzyme
MGYENGAGKKAGKARYNILMITTDQEQSFTDIPDCVALPNRERIRKNAVAYRNFHVNTTPCGPSRSVIYTGQHTQKTGMFANPNVPPHVELPRDMPTLGSIFRSLGYYTAYKGKWHLSNLNHGVNFDAQRYPQTVDELEPWGFSEYTHDGDHHGIVWDGFKHDGAIAADTANWLLGLDGRRPTDQPWLMCANFVNPHDIMFFDATGTMKDERLDPLRVAPCKPAPFSKLYAERLPHRLPDSFVDTLADKPQAHRSDQRLADMMYGRLPRTDEASWLNHLNYYYNCIRDVDRHIGTVLDALQQSGEAENTIVVFTSDHGEMAGAHGMRQKGASMYKEVVNVSLFIDHPDVSQSNESEHLASSVDIVPTLLELTGIEASDYHSLWPDLVGVALTDTLSGEQSERDKRGMLLNYTCKMAWDLDIVEALFTGQTRGEFTAEEGARLGQGVSLQNLACFRGIHDGRYKFARYFKPAEHHHPADWQTLLAHNELELYDTVEDPLEVDNLAVAAEDHRPLIERLNKQLNELIKAEIGIDDGSCYSKNGEYTLR